MIRRLKLAYSLYNIFHKRELEHNIPIYKKYGIKKKYYSSISSEDFKVIDSNQIHAIQNSKQAEKLVTEGRLGQDLEEKLTDFDKYGFCVLPNYLTTEQVKHINTDIEQLLETNKIKFKYRNKLMFAFHKSKVIREICRNKELGEFLNCLIKGQAQLFQSINFLSGSEQETHSDSIHMTTFPLGGLLGVWIALEDIDEKNGPIHYYPKSHKLPYYMNRDYDNLGNKYLLGDKGYTAYEEMIKVKLKENSIKKEVFKASKGDMFIWHANLLHGGEPHIDKSRSRKSMVLHYFDSNRICYHEITQRPALIKKDYG